jgi:hypothetical protein
MLRIERKSPLLTVALALCLGLAGLSWTAPAAAQESESSESGPTTQKVTRLQGRAYLGRRQPVVGASVVARKEDGTGKIYLTTTDEKGLLRIDDLPDGDYRVEIRKSGLETVVKNAVQVKFPFRPTVEIAMREGGEEAAPGATPASGASGFGLSGRVEERNRQGIPEVMIRFQHATGDADPRVLRTIGDGSFEAGGLAAGDYHVEIRGVGFLPIRSTVKLDGPSSFAVCLVPQPAEYVSSPLDMMPPEEPVPPPGFE